MGSPFERRRWPRLLTVFGVKIARTGQTSEIEAVTRDISQGGALILTPHWRTFTPDERADLRFFLPPDFTGQSRTLILTGAGVVRRLDGSNNAIAVEFLRRLGAFDPSWEVQG